MESNKFHPNFARYVRRSTTSHHIHLTCTKNIQFSPWRESENAVQRRSSSKEKVPKHLQTESPFSPMTRTRNSSFIRWLFSGAKKLKGRNVILIEEGKAWKLTSADG
jgi:hypothetical protein